MRQVDTPRKESTQTMKTVTHLSLPTTSQRLLERNRPQMSRAEMAHLIRLGLVVSAITVVLATAARVVSDVPASLLVMSAFAVALALGLIDSWRQARLAEQRPRRIRIRV